MNYLKTLTIIAFLSFTPLKAYAIVGPSFPWPFDKIFLGLIHFCHWCDQKEKQVEELVAYYYPTSRSKIREADEDDF